MMVKLTGRPLYKLQGEALLFNQDERELKHSIEFLSSSKKTQVLTKIQRFGHVKCTHIIKQEGELVELIFQSISAKTVDRIP